MTPTRPATSSKMVEPPAALLVATRAHRLAETVDPQWAAQATVVAVALATQARAMRAVAATTAARARPVAETRAAEWVSPRPVRAARRCRVASPPSPQGAGWTLLPPTSP